MSHRLFINLLALLLGFFIGGYSVFSHAETPVTQFSYAFLSGWYSEGAGGHCGASISARNAAFPALPPASFTRVQNSFCMGLYDSDPVEHAITNFVSRSWCVAVNLASSGGTCPVALPVDCASKNGQSSSSGYYDIGTSPTAKPSWLPVSCSGGCTLVFSGESPAGRSIQGGVYHYYAKGSLDYDGTQCTEGDSFPQPSSTDSTPPVSTCAENQTAGTVNGKTVCVDKVTGDQADPNASDSNTQSDKQVDTTVSTDANGCKVFTTTTNKGDGTKTTTTDTQCPDGSGSKTEATSGADPLKDFCATNPDNSMCKQKTECEEHPERASCMDVGDVPDAEDIVSKGIPITFNEVDIPQDASCPAPISLSIGGHAIELDFDIYCQYCAGIRPVLLASAYLTAALIIVGGLKDGG